MITKEDVNLLFATISSLQTQANDKRDAFAISELSVIYCGTIREGTLKHNLARIIISLTDLNYDTSDLVQIMNKLGMD